MSGCQRRCAGEGRWLRCRDRRIGRRPEDIGDERVSQLGESRGQCRGGLLNFLLNDGETVPDGSGADQRAPGKRQEGRIDHTQHVLFEGLRRTGRNAATLAASALA